MVKKLLGFAVAVLISGGLLFAWRLWHGGTVISLNQLEIQQAVNVGFPIEKTYLGILRVQLRDPVVTLQESSDRIALAVKVDVGIPGIGRPAKGEADLSCKIRYDAAQGAFYADDPQVERLTLEGHPDGVLEKTSGAVTWIVKGLLANRPIYTLSSVDVGHSFAKLVLKDVRVKSGTLRLTLGIDPGPAAGS
ncbi:MAG TPA: DUF1439 domain-containing protein [Planctomycetota bacterium]|nr:DUF1439 domain-containing protein [Planctomycetota bacterium]